jgi:hypothetical protein
MACFSFQKPAQSRLVRPHRSADNDTRKSGSCRVKGTHGGWSFDTLEVRQSAWRADLAAAGIGRGNRGCNLLKVFRSQAERGRIEPALYLRWAAGADDGAGYGGPPRSMRPPRLRRWYCAAPRWVAWGL